MSVPLPGTMAASSLARRLFLTATAVTALVLVVIGLTLSSLYRASLERAFDRRLDVYLKTIVADVANAPSGVLPEIAAIGEPLFDFPSSGWYWQVTKLGDSPAVRRSNSLPAAGLPTLEKLGFSMSRGGLREGYIAGPHDQWLRVIEQRLDLGEDGRFIVTVAGNAEEIDEEADDFNNALLLTFGALGLAFVGTAWFQVRFGLRPLTRISESLARIRSGRAERLEGDFPEEIEPLAREVNALIDSNREIVDRARTHVGNLAHALKTPLSILLNEAAARDDSVSEKVREQVGIMREQVQHHLERARIAARVVVTGTATDVAPVVEGVVRTMAKIYRERSLVIDTRIVDAVKFHGERHDLEEMLANLVDNACKWASSRVEVELLAEKAAAGRPFFRAIIDDDGPGLSGDARQEVLSRGKRLDESKPGSGLGLSIVLDLATLYGGRLELGTAPIGGLRAELVLPAPA